VLDPTIRAADVSASRDPGTPSLALSGYHGYNLVAYSDWFFAIPQALGPIDLTRPEDRQRPQILEGPSLHALSALITKTPEPSRDEPTDNRDGMAPVHLTSAAHAAEEESPLFIESRRDFNIYLYASKYFAYPQTDGAFDMARVRAGTYSRLIVGSTLAEVIGELELVSAAPGDVSSVRCQEILVIATCTASDAARYIAGLENASITVLSPPRFAHSWRDFNTIVFRDATDAPQDQLDPDSISSTLLDQLKRRRFDAVALVYGADWNWTTTGPERMAAAIASRLIAIFDGGARSYKGEDIHRIVYNKSYLSSMFSVVPATRGKRVLEVGCSDGLVCNMILATQPSRIVGIDVLATVGCNYPDPAIEYLNMDAERMSFEADTFDLTYSIATLEHCQEPLRVIEEMLRVTRPGGYCYVQAGPLYYSPYGHHMFGYFDEFPWLHLRLSKDQIVQYARRTRADVQIRENLGRPAEDYIDSMLRREHINGKRFAEYRLDEFAKRRDIEVLKYTRSYEGESLLTPGILAEVKNVAREDLIAHGFELAFRVL
jgi:SAM-dependent methyltransferase